MQRVVDVNGISFYVIYERSGADIRLHGIACATSIVLYQHGIPLRLSKFEKIYVDEAAVFSLDRDGQKSFEAALIEAIDKAQNITKTMNKEQMQELMASVPLP